VYVSSNTSQRLARLRLVFSRWRALAPEEQATWAAEAAAASVCVRGWGGGRGRCPGGSRWTWACRMAHQLAAVVLLGVNTHCVTMLQQCCFPHTGPRP
jgi:hypothetical protein